MPEDKRQFNDGYKPEKVERGYQPSKPKEEATGETKPLSGYTPTTGTGGGPVNNPTPPGDE